MQHHHYTHILLAHIPLLHTHTHSNTPHSHSPHPTQTRVHYLELLFRMVATTNYPDHKHRQHDIITSLNRIAQEENSEGTADYELVKKIWKTYPGIFEEITDL